MNLSRTAKSMLNAVAPTAVIPAPLAAPLAWFSPPAEMAEKAAAGVAQQFNLLLDGDETGRTYGHVAPRRTCILDGRPGCWSIPDGPEFDDLSYSMQGFYETAEGETISVGVIPMDCNHAGPDDDAVDFMANTGTQLAIVRSGYDEVGIWSCGVISPGLTYSQAVRARAAAQSGDWRPLLSEIRFDDGSDPQYRYTGSVVVNVPGLPLSVRLAAQRSHRTQFGPAIVIPQEAPMSEIVSAPTEAPSAVTAGSVYRVEVKPPLEDGDEVFFGTGRRGRVEDIVADQAGALMVIVQEVFDDGTMLTEEVDMIEAIVVPLSEVIPTGRRFRYDDYVDTPLDVVTAAAETPAPCACHKPAVVAASVPAGGGTPTDPMVPDPTNDIMLERLDAVEKSIAAFNERLDTLEASVAMSNESAQVAAALRIV